MVALASLFFHKSGEISNKLTTVSFAPTVNVTMDFDMFSLYDFRMI